MSLRLERSASVLRLGPESGAARNRGRLLASVLACVAVLLWPALRSVADEAEDLDDQIPSGRFYSAAVLAGTDMYILGGKLQNGTVVSDVLTYTPAAGGNATKVGNLPFAVDSISAIWNGSAIFAFGGNSDGDRTRIVRYNVTGNTSDVVANFSSSRGFTSAVRVENDAYIFGGVGTDNGQEAYRGEVVRFNTTSFAVDTVVSNNATMARAGTSAVWDGNSAYMFAGDHCPLGGGVFGRCDDVVRYTPSDDSITIMAAKFPSRRSNTAAAWDGLTALIFGDHTTGGTDEIWRYRPSNDTLTQMSAHLPLPRGFPSAAWNGTYVYVATGSHSTPTNDSWPTKIVRYSLTPGKPQGLLINSTQGGPVEIGLWWNPPADNTYTYPITNYTLTRNPLGAGVDRVYTFGNETSFTDTDVVFLTTYCYKVTATNAQGESAPFPGLLDDPVCAVAW